MAMNSDTMVDMLAFARETTRRENEAARAKRGVAAGRQVRVMAPAKINVVLAVGARRADGYHDVQNVMQAIMLHDTLTMWLLDGAGAGDAAATSDSAGDAAASSRGVVTCECVACEGLPPVDAAAEDNLAVRAVRALAQRIFADGAAAAPGIGIRIEKHVPARAGLGGGSSDAAAALLGAAHLWEAAGALPADAGAGAPSAGALLEEVAQSLGADVAFFLRGAAALYDGAGEHFVRALRPRKDSAVIIQPAGGLGTAEVYRAFDSLQAAVPSALSPATPATLSDALLQAQDVIDVPFFNNLQPAAAQLLPDIEAIVNWANAQPGVSVAQMSGSGSAVFALCADFASACKLAGAAKAQGWWARTTACGPVRAAILPD